MAWLLFRALLTLSKTSTSPTLCFPFKERSRTVASVISKLSYWFTSASGSKKTRSRSLTTLISFGCRFFNTMPPMIFSQRGALLKIPMISCFRLRRVIRSSRRVIDLFWFIINRADPRLSIVKRPTTTITSTNENPLFLENIKGYRSFTCKSVI